MSDKRLYRSSVNYMLTGVCGGIAEYFNIDPTLVRLAWVIFTCCKLRGRRGSLYCSIHCDSKVVFPKLYKV